MCYWAAGPTPHTTRAPYLPRGQNVLSQPPSTRGASALPSEPGYFHRLPLRLLCESMKRQIVSRAFYGCECRVRWGQEQGELGEAPLSWVLATSAPHRAGLLPPPVHGTDPSVSAGASQHHPSHPAPGGLRGPHQGCVEQISEGRKGAHTEEPGPEAGSKGWGWGAGKSNSEYGAGCPGSSSH